MYKRQILEFSEAKDFGSLDDKWVKDSEIYLNSLLEKVEEKSSKEAVDMNSNFKDYSKKDE